MTKIIILLLTVPFVFGVFAHNSVGYFEITQNILTSPTPPAKKNSAPEVKSLVLDKTTLKLPCPPGSRSFSGSCTDDMRVKVSAEVFDAENDKIIYQYTVTGGRIVGEGANVYWDLNGVRPGIYTITAAADDGFGFNGKTKTAEITVAECDSCGSSCECPILSVNVSKRIFKDGETVEFTANVMGGSQDEVNYKWTVKGGTIVEGQKTKKIEVSPFKNSNKVKATVEISTICDEVCEIASASAESRSTTDFSSDVEDVILDEDVVYTICRGIRPVSSMCSEEQKKINVITLVRDKTNEILHHYYQVSGGRIIGEGANVIWDLTNARIGEYTITARADDGYGLCGKTVTKTVKVVECDPCDPPCECPLLSVSGPSHIVKKGEIIEFKANVRGGSEEPTYSWSVDEFGEILEGQGTSKIKVKILRSDVVTVTVELGGLCESCPATSASKSTPID